MCKCIECGLLLQYWYLQGGEGHLNIKYFFSKEHLKMKSPYNFLENIEIFSKNMLLKIHMKVKSEKLKFGSELKV